MIDKQGFTFYPQSWLDDAKLTHCSLAAKGMWIDLLCHMHNGDPYGHLVFNSKVLSKEDVQKLLRITNQEVFDIAWQELLNKKIILQEHGSGAYYSKRMTYEHKQQRRSMSDIKKSPLFPVAEEIIGHLNDVAKRDYPVNVENFELIERWLKEGRTVKEFKVVNEVKTAEWEGSAKTGIWIRPSTLYGDKFLNYLNQNPNHKLTAGGSGRKWKFKDYYATQHNDNNTDGRNTDTR